MNPYQSLGLLAALAILGGCGDPPADQASTAPDEPIEAIAPTDEQATTAGIDAGALYTRLCVVCHGANGEGVGDNPALAGLSGDDIQAKLVAYRAGETVGPKSAIMAPMARNLSDEEIATLAALLGG
jgi:cytochrome c553